MINIKVNNNVNLNYDLVNRKVMSKVGFAANTIIKKRTQRGVDFRGKKFDSYSTKGALMPIKQGGEGGSTQKMKKFYMDQLRSKRGGTKKGKHVSARNSKAKWVFLPDGYKQYRHIQGRTVRKVNLMFSGMMFKNMRIKRSRDKSVLIGFTGEQARKAYYHNISGAGSSKVKRIFQRIDKPKEIKKLRNIVDRHIKRELKR